MPSFDDDEMLSDSTGIDQIPVENPEMSSDQEEEIDLQALADVVYALLVRELQLELERLGQ